MIKPIEHIKAFASRYFIFGNLKRPIVPLKYNLMYWRPENGDNVGDYISKVVYEWCLERFDLKMRPFKTYRICVIGSVLSFLGGGRNIVWGTGLMNRESVKALLNPYKRVCLDIRAVRGPKTWAALNEVGIACPQIFGDPAILMPLIYRPSVAKCKGKILIIPHESRYEKYASRFENVINTYTSDYKAFIDEVASSEKVISSSLHGLILAESYGVPAVFLNDYPGSRFKYEDYYMSTGRSTFPIVDDIEQIAGVEGEINGNLQDMQMKLLASFPKDIFR